MPPLQQEFHKGLPGIFQKLLINIDSASIIHMESSVLEISGMFQIDNYATTADEKRESSFSGSVNVLNGCRVASVFPAVV